MKTYGAIFITGAVIGFLIYHLFFKPEIEIREVETIVYKTDTMLVSWNEYIELSNYADSLEIALSKKPKVEIRHKVLRDTFLVDYKPKIQEFSATFPTLYGNAFLQGEVLGEVLKTSLRTDFRIPIITNTIEKTTARTSIEKPSGLYAAGNLNSNFHYSVGAVFLRDRSLFQYQYQPQTKVHSLGVGFKVF